MKLPAVPLLLVVGLAVACRAQTSPAPAPANPEGKSDRSATSGGSTKKSTAPLPRIILGGNQTKATPSAPAKPAAAPATKDATAGKEAKKAAKEDEAPARIAGMEITRGAKGFLGLQVSGGTFQLAFYDPKKKPAKADVVRAVLRWTPNYKPGNEIYVLEPSGDGLMLTSPKNVRPPYQFKLFVSLFAGAAEEPTESFVLDFRQ